MRQYFILSLVAALLSCGQKKSTNDEQTVAKDTTASVKTIVKDSPTPAPLPDEAIVNDLLKENAYIKWRVLNDLDPATDKPSDYDYDVKTGRKKDPNYPFIVKGDFNGDGKIDYLAMVTNGEKEYDRQVARVAIIPGDGTVSLNEEYSTVHTILTVISKGTKVEGYEGDKQMKFALQNDAVEINNHDTGGYLIFWNGKFFSILYTET